MADNEVRTFREENELTPVRILEWWQEPGGWASAENCAMQALQDIEYLVNKLTEVKLAPQEPEISRRILSNLAKNIRRAFRDNKAVDAKVTDGGMSLKVGSRTMEFELKDLP